MRFTAALGASAILASLGQGIQLDNNSDEKRFNDWATLQGRNYSSASERAMRMANFIRNENIYAAINAN